MTTTDLTADDVVWDLAAAACPHPATRASTQLLDARRRARRRARGRARARSPSSTPTGSPTFMHGLAELHDLIGRAGSYAGLDFAPTRPIPRAARGCSRSRSAARAIGTKLLFFELEWAELPDDRADALLADDRLAFAAHHLRSARRYRPHLLTEPEEVVLTEKSVTGRSAWERLFDEQVSAITVELDGETTHARSRALAAARARPRRAPGRGRRGHRRPRSPACARARSCSTRCSPTRRSTTACATSTRGSRAATSSNEASDESVQALVDAVQGRYAIPQRWYALKAQLLGLDRLADYDRMASVADVEREIGWAEAKDLVLDAYASFSRRARRHRAPLLRRRVDRRARAAGQAARRVLRVHRAVAPPVPVAELDVAPPRRAHARARARPRPARVPRARAGRLPPDDAADARRDRVGVRRDGHVRPAARTRSTDPQERLALLASNLEDQIATVFRQIAMNRFEDAMHTARREAGRAVGRALRRALGEHADATCSATRSRSPTATARGGRTSRTSSARPATCTRTRTASCSRCRCTRATRSRGTDFVPQYLDLLRAGGSMSPEELGRDRRRRPRRPRLLGPRPRHHRAPPRRDDRRPRDAPAREVRA